MRWTASRETSWSSGGRRNRADPPPCRRPIRRKKRKLPLAKGEKLCYGVGITIEVAEAKSPGESAGWEPGGGKSAESRCRARLWDGDGENISATVRGRIPVVALSAYDANAVQSR